MRGIEDRLHDAVLREAPAVPDPDLVLRGLRAAERLNRARGGAPLAAWYVLAGRNAFALPGGRVYVGRELLVGGASDALLAFVVAHEMAHHDLGHCGLPPAIDGDGGGDARVLREVAHATTRSAAEESAADGAALELCRRAGYAESGAREAFELLAAVEAVARDRGAGELTVLETVVDCLGIARPRAPIAARRQTLWGLERPAGYAAAPRGYTATGMVVACTRCDARFAPRTLCPRCGGSSLVDFRHAAERDEWLALTGGSARTRAVVRPHPAPGLLPPRTTSVRGAVRVVRATISPLGFRGAAWRVRGGGDDLPIDDAGVGAFDVVVGGTIMARVDADDALVDLGRGPRATPRVIDEPLAAFLHERGRVPARAIALAETVLEDDDRVEVTGVADELVLAEGYRDSTTVPLFRDWPAIRKLEPVR